MVRGKKNNERIWNNLCFARRNNRIVNFNSSENVKGETMRLIDADALKFNIACMYGSNPKYLNWLNNAPTVDAVPVRHGEWIEQWRTTDTRMLRCSECKMVFNVGNGREGNYCPNCGARMNGTQKKPCDDCQQFDCYGCEYAGRKEE